MIIGNVLTTNNINIGNEFNVVKTFDQCVKGLPTLIIGYDEVLKISSKDKVNVLHRSIDSTTFWTFNRTDNRMIFDNDIEDFIRFSYKFNTKNLNYIDVDLIQEGNRRLVKIVKKILSLNDYITYESDNNILYMLSNNLIFGIDLNTARYIGFDIDKIKSKAKSISKVYLSGNEPLIEFGDDLERLDNDIKLLPYLYSINPME